MTHPTSLRAPAWSLTRILGLPADTRIGPVPVIAATVLLVIVLASIFAPLLAPHDPLALSPTMRLKPGSAEYLLGTDAFGRDLLSRVLYGGQVSLLIGLSAAAASVVIGLAIGLVGGGLIVFFSSVYIGGVIGMVSHHLFWQRTSIPATYLAIGLALVFDLTLLGWCLVNCLSSPFHPLLSVVA